MATHVGTCLTSHRPFNQTLPEAFDAYYQGHISRSGRPAMARKLGKPISTQLPHLADRAPIASSAARGLSSIRVSSRPTPTGRRPRIDGALSSRFFSGGPGS